MKRTILVLTAAGAIITLGLWWTTRHPRGTTQDATTGDGAADLAEAIPLVNEPPPYDPALNALNLPGVSIQKDLAIVHGMLDRYRFIAKDPQGNPPGDNREIVRALQGRNRAGIAFLPQRHPTINEKGELVDRWGTPFFFHALAHDRMEIRSAGPDQKFWTADDAVFPPQRRPDDYPISLSTSANEVRVSSP